MTGNIIVSTCCLGERPRTRGHLQPYHPHKHVLTITYCMTGRAIYTGEYSVLARPQGGTI